MKLKLLLIGIVLFLTGCISMEVDYLDDNYSDRVELAQKILGSDSVYFDTSNYQKSEEVSIAVPVTEVKSSRKIVGGGVQALVEQFELISESYRKITISGNLSSESAKVILSALSKVAEQKLAGIQIHYIGDLEYLSEIKMAVENKGAEFSFSKMPETSI